MLVHLRPAADVHFLAKHQPLLDDEHFLDDGDDDRPADVADFGDTFDRPIDPYTLDIDISVNKFFTDADIVHVITNMYPEMTRFDFALVDAQLFFDKRDHRLVVRIGLA